MSTRTIELPEHLDRFIDDAVRSGRGSDASDIVREGLELLEQQGREDRAKLEWLRNAVREADESLARGEGTVLRSREELEGFLSMISERARLRATPNAT
jgi:putative addiction module CopG family antidote